MNNITTAFLIMILGGSVLLGIYPNPISFVWKILYFLFWIFSIVNTRTGMIKFLIFNAAEKRVIIIVTVILIALDFLNFCVQWGSDNPDERFKFPSFCVDVLSLVCSIFI